MAHEINVMVLFGFFANELVATVHCILLIAQDGRAGHRIGGQGRKCAFLHLSSRSSIVENELNSDQ